ncbi:MULTISPECIES: hypothetical protein [Flavobacterium]|uniref:Uncharacterized protein n=1 Tax=Flavobacterium keumense TaxID=1306518 RepID=A0ABY8N2A2_9FLAO|nr:MULTISPECIES: hypothetical protein [Flavobacterium]WGK93790.1 hypothetical protein MG292_06715 [Flavobacterium keumense]
MGWQEQKEYYDNESLHGGYQFTSLKTIVDNMLLEAEDDDSYIKNVKRSRIINYAKQAIRTVNRQAANDVLAIEVTVPTHLSWVLPQDYVNYVRISVVIQDASDGSFKLYPLDVNRNISVATGYLQDNNAELLFDSNGNTLTADSSNGYAKPFKTYVFSDEYQPTLNTSKLSKYGEFTIDERRGTILFSSDLSDREVVIEYTSDGLQAELLEEEITVHKYLRETIENWIYFSCIERKRNVPANEKQRALQRYRTTLHQAKIARADFNLLQISRVLRSRSMTI